VFGDYEIIVIADCENMKKFGKAGFLSLLVCYFLLVYVSISAEASPLRPKQESTVTHEHRQDIRNKPIHANFEKALELIQNVSNLIYQRYEFHNTNWFQFFLGSSNLGSESWDLIKYKIAKKILLFHPHSSEKTPNATYLMIFGGSSVTAGHDNYYQDAYPFVFERRMNDIFHELGMKLLVHNIAQGDNHCRPSDYCYEAQGGDNPDFLSWEQSFNCGKEKDIFELMARIAYWSGGVVYYSASGGFIPNKCGPTTDSIPWASEEWTPANSGKKKKSERKSSSSSSSRFQITGDTETETETKTAMKTTYQITAETTKTYRNALNEAYQDGNSVSHFTTETYGDSYKGAGPHGYNVFAKSKKICNNNNGVAGGGCVALDQKGECHENGGPHWMVAESAYYGFEKGKPGKHWHPPAAMHLMRGELLAYNFVHILADTIWMVQEDLKTMTIPHAFESKQRSSCNFFLSF
jgi:hypothetical protein